ncbi:leucine-rich repeat-containing protein 4-like [Lineus longissimus]|uniref:leucine-rich repeat-containing protein 4-like n=1 Tax=Lineus longissimus TaxID=88925 RepID=UPI00315CCB7C
MTIKMRLRTEPLLLLVYLLLHPGSQAFQDCPVKCSCSDSGTVVDCSNQGLQQVPTSLPPAVIRLILRNNSISEIDPNRVVTAPRLSHLDVSHNKLANIPEALMNSLPAMTVANFSNNNINILEIITCRLWPSLVEFDISHNNVQFLKSGFFIPCNALQKLNLGWNQLEGKSLLGVRYISALQHLDLSGNRMPILIANAFIGLPNLQSLKVSQSGTRMIYDETFAGLNNLQFLDLSYNDFYELAPAPFYKLKALWVLNLGGIKFLCACGLNTLKTWIAQNNLLLQSPVICVVPKPSQTLDIRYTDMLQFCPPTTSPLTSALSTEASSICDSATPSDMRVTNITNTSAMLRWDTGGYHLPSVLVLRNIGGVAVVKATSVDLDAKQYRFTGLQADTDFVACVKIDLCGYEQCALYRTLGPDNSDRTTLVSLTDPSPGTLSLAAAVSVSVIVTILIFMGCFVSYVVYTKKLQILEKIYKGEYSPSHPVRNPAQSTGDDIGDDTQLPVQNGGPVRTSADWESAVDNEETLQVPSPISPPESLYNNPSYAEPRNPGDIIWGVPRSPAAHPQEDNTQRPPAALPRGYASISTEDISKPTLTVYDDLLPEDQQRIVFAVGRSPGNGGQAPDVVREPHASCHAADLVNPSDVDLQVSDSENEGHYCNIKDCDIQDDVVTAPPDGAKYTNIEKDREHVLGGKSGTPHWKNFVPASMFEADNYENAARGERVEPGGLYANVDP